MGGEKIPLLSEQPIKSLGMQYTVELTDEPMGRTVMKQLSEGLAKIDQSQLPGKYKIWCNQFTLYRRVMWPLKMSEIPSSTASKMDGKANAFIRKWLGCHSASLKRASSEGTPSSCRFNPSVWTTSR